MTRGESPSPARRMIKEEECLGVLYIGLKTLLESYIYSLPMLKGIPG